MQLLARAGGCLGLGNGQMDHLPVACPSQIPSARLRDPRAALDHRGCPDPYQRAMLVRIPLPHTAAVPRAGHPLGLTVTVSHPLFRKGLEGR